MPTLDLLRLRIPFRVAFKHASAERHVTQGFLVFAGDDGITGYGEGCPRDYVTGETDASVAAFFARHRADIAATVTDAASLRAWTEAHQSDIDANPAAWCAIELALLDLFARRASCSVENLLDLPPLSGRFRYSAILGAMDAPRFAETLSRYRKRGLRDYKIKFVGTLDHDRANLAALRAAGIAPGDVRADANNAWSDYATAHAYIESLNYPFAAIEEPLSAGRFDDLARLAQAFDTRIVLDESVTRAQQLAQLPGDPRQWIVNLRVSKMGGILRSLAVVQGCRERGIGVIVGAQVGETSLLTRAASTVAQAARDMLVAQEGAFGTLLLESDAMQPSLMFGTRGELDVGALQLDRAAGFGLSPVPDLDRYLEDAAQ